MSRQGSVKKDPATGLWGFVVDIAPAGAPRKQIRRRGYKTRREAQAALDSLKADHVRGGFVEPAKVTVAEYLEEWLQLQAAAGLRPSTLNSYRRNIRLHVAPAIGAGRLQGLTATDLDRLYRQLLAAGRRDGKGGLAPRTVRYVHTILRKAFVDAVRKSLLTRNPADASDPPSAKASKARDMAIWTPAELRAFLDAVAGHQLHPLLRTASMTGMRRGELLGLRWEDIDFERALITVKLQLADIDPESRPILAPPKTERGRRTIDLDQVTCDVLRPRRRIQLEEQLAFGPAYRNHGLVFTRPDGAPLVGDDVSKAFIRMARRAGLPRIRFHDLRHSHASHLFAAGADVKSVSARLGHASASFTLDVYGHLIPGQQAQAAARVAEMVDG